MIHWEVVQDWYIFDYRTKTSFVVKSAARKVAIIKAAAHLGHRDFGICPETEHVSK